MSKDQWLDRLQELIPRFQQISQHFDLAAAESLGLNLTDLQVMEQVLRRGPQAASALADAVGLSRGATTTALDRLERAGFVSRVRTDEDRRAVIVHLTDRALERVHSIWGPLSTDGDKVLKRYSAVDLEVIVTFLDDAIRLQERHLLRLRGRASSSF